MLSLHTPLTVTHDCSLMTYCRIYVETRSLSLHILYIWAKLRSKDSGSQVVKEKVYIYINVKLTFS